MRVLLIVLLVVVFGYSLALVIFNNTNVIVDLLFMTELSMNLGLVIILSISLGLIIGMLLAVLVFKVVQNKWEINRLNKENKRLKGDLEKSQNAIERQESVATLDQPILKKVEKSELNNESAL